MRENRTSGLSGGRRPAPYQGASSDPKPMKEPNKVQKAAEAPEGRPVTKENSGEDDGDLYTETRGNLERTIQDT